MVHMLSYDGSKIGSYRPHTATINDIEIDEDGDFVATASVEGASTLIGFNTNPVTDDDFPQQGVSSYTP